MELREAYAYCKAVINRHSSTFAAAFAHLPAEDSNAVWAVYAFCRHVDDIVDEGDSLLADRWRELNQFQSHFRAMSRGDLASKTPVLIALSDVFSRYQMNSKPFEDMIFGQRMDLRFAQPKNLLELEDYCYYVAGTVGLMLLPILHKEPADALERQVVALGVAMQLTNILRDVSEDAKRGRIYIPAQLLDEHGVTEQEIRQGMYSESWFAVAESIGNRAELLYREGLSAARAFSPSSQVAVTAAGHLYQGIFRKIQACNYNVFGVRHYVDGAERKRIMGQLTAELAKSRQESVVTGVAPLMGWNQACR